MREQWYGDKRDIVKWATVIHLARERGVKNVLQVAYFRRDKTPDPLCIDDALTVPVPPEVWRHFRDLHQIQGLAAATGLQIEVFACEFSGKRDLYTQEVVRRIASYSEPLLILLDPDTGLAPASGGSYEHVTRDELAQVYRAMRPGDILVFYQHKWRCKAWLEDARRDFCNATQELKENVRTVTCFDIAGDVAFFVVQHPP